jgi:hypothetical protein
VRVVTIALWKIDFFVRLFVGIFSWYYSDRQIWRWLHYVYCHTFAYSARCCGMRRQCPDIWIFRRKGLKILRADEIDPTRKVFIPKYKGMEALK